jgi:Meckelin (Transmembrane protein 67)
VLYHDDLGITNCVLLGLENHMLVFYSSLFIYVHIVTANSLIGALVVWVVEFVLCFIRTHYGEKNISKKCLLDSKFLI